MSSEKTSALRAAGAAPAPALSPIVPLLPTGYRDIQPFLRGQGWHTNGKATARLRQARGVSERVVFPAIPTHQGGVSGPTASAVDGHDALTTDKVPGDDDHEREEAERRATSPPVSAIPVPPATRPRRPSSGSQAEGNQRAASGSFRTRAIAAAVQGSTNGLLSPTSSVSGRSEDEEEPIPPPDPATMEKLWQEYNERTRHPTRTIDKETYHRKMHNRYNENKALKERIARLESELEEMQRERDEAMEESRRLAEQTVGNTKWKDADPEEPGQSLLLSRVENNLDVVSPGATSARQSPRRESSKPTFASVVSRLSTTYKLPLPSQNGTVSSLEEISYRERCFKLERTMAAAKEGVTQLQARLMAMHTNDRQTIETLRAQLELEQQASKTLSVQLRETNAAFRSVADELVTTQIALDKEQIEKQIVVEQIQAETRQLISDQKRKELQSRVKNVVRTLGKEALRQKMEALHTRVISAEHHMRVAQLEVTRLKQERNQQQERLDEILSSREIKYHCLAPKDGGIPGILRRATTLFQGTRTINEQYLMVHMLYEDTRTLTDSRASGAVNQVDPPSDPEDGYCIHILVYDAFSAQDDYVTFHLRDIQRLVPDAEKYLARFADRKMERFRELADILFGYCQIGYKNGHIVVTERPVTMVEAAANERSSVVIYRGSRFLKCLFSDCGTEDRLVDFVVNEVCNPATSQLWWLEVHASVVDYDNQELSCQVTIDYQGLKTLVPSLASYRPSESLELSRSGDVIDDRDILGIHEDLLDPLFAQMELRRPTSTPLESLNVQLVVMDVDGINVLCGDARPNDSLEVSNENQDSETEDLGQVDGVCTNDNSPPPPVRVLDHRSIVCVSDTFYCVRIEEIWDGELMLRVTMEEPDDTTRRYETLISEREIATIASYLYKSGVCQEDYAASIKYGLPSILHDPVCKTLKKHAEPEADPINAKPCAHAEAVLRRISFDSLYEEIQHATVPRKSADFEERIAATMQTLSLQQAAKFGPKRVERVVIMGDGIDEKLIQEVQLSLREGGDEFNVHKQRIAGRFKTLCAYATAVVFSGLVAPLNDIVVVNIQAINDCSVPSQDSVITAGLVVANISVSQVLNLLGFAGSTSN